MTRNLPSLDKVGASVSNFSFMTSLCRKPCMMTLAFATVPCSVFFHLWKNLAASFWRCSSTSSMEWFSWQGDDTGDQDDEAPTWQVCVHEHPNDNSRGWRILLLPLWRWDQSRRWSSWITRGWLHRWRRECLQRCRPGRRLWWSISVLPRPTLWIVPEVQVWQLVFWRKDAVLWCRRQSELGLRDHFYLNGRLCQEGQADQHCEVSQNDEWWSLQRCGEEAAASFDWSSGMASKPMSTASERIDFFVAGFYGVTLCQGHQWGKQVSSVSEGGNQRTQAEHQ